jgi:hypothetical protein
MVRTADATNTIAAAVSVNGARPLVATPAANAYAAEQPTKLLSIDGKIEMLTPPAPTPVTVDADKPAEAPAPEMPIVEQHPAAAEPAPPVHIAKRRASPVSVFISRREAKLYVRQDMHPLFEMRVTIEHPDQPIGTHVYTAMAEKPDGSGLRWTVMSIPSSYKHAPESKKFKDGRKQRADRSTRIDTREPAPVPSASAALDRLVMPPEAVQRISALITPGSSLIVSDNKLSDETGPTTDFIVLTP